MNRALTLVALALFTHSYPAFALDLMTRPVGPVQTWQASDLARFTDQFVHVKFVEGSDVVWRGDHFADDQGHDLSVVRGALRKSDVLEVRSTFDVTRQMARAWKAEGEAQSGVVGPDLSLWYTIRVGGGAEAVAKLINDLNASPAVEIAHPEPIVETADIVTPGPKADPAAASAVPPDFTGQQQYLYAPPVGLNAPAAWAVAGGRGQGGKFIDVELAWIENHVDFPFARFFYMGGAGQDPSQGYIDHGTAVLGEVIGQQTGFGIDGFAHELDGYGVVAITVAEWPNVPHYFQEAVDHLTAGDVWLIELQMYPPLTGQATPMEWLQVNYDVIWTSSWARNIICVEAGANGAQNLDAAIWGGVFDRNVRDSGAIMVGAGTPFGLVAEGFSNYGTRMDVHAWGSSIVTTGYGDLYTEGPQTTWYTSHFGGTSGASPMVTGAALCLGGVARAAQIPFTPLLIRTILHDTGTPQAGTRLIGPRPNLGAAVTALLATAGVEHQAAAAVDWKIETTPNPFAETVQLRLDGVGRDPLQVGIYDATGRRLRGLLESPLGTGPRVVSWDGRDDRGKAVGSGVYFVKISAPGFERTVKVQKIH